MTSKQIKTILNELGYNLDTPIPLDVVSSIYLTTDGCLYPDGKTLFEFKSGTDMNLLLVYDANVINGELIKENTPKAVISCDVVAGFTLVSSMHMKAPYTVSRAV